MRQRHPLDCTRCGKRVTVTPNSRILSPSIKTGFPICVCKGCGHLLRLEKVMGYGVRVWDGDRPFWDMYRSQFPISFANLITFRESICARMIG